MTKKHAIIHTVKSHKDQVIDFAKKNPVLLAGIVFLAALVLSSYVSYLRAQEILPETQAAAGAPKPLRMGKGDTFSWLGMEVAPLSSMLRKEFNIPGKIKGMYVIDEGRGQAFQYGIKTADIIVSISRQNVATARDFVRAANGVRFREGIVMDIYRNGKNLFISIPFSYQYGPLMGPNKGTWQLGSPVFGQGVQYGPVFR